MTGDRLTKELRRLAKLLSAAAVSVEVIADEVASRQQADPPSRPNDLPSEPAPAVAKLEDAVAPDVPDATPWEALVERALTLLRAEPTRSWRPAELSRAARDSGIALASLQGVHFGLVARLRQVGAIEEDEAGLHASALLAGQPPEEPEAPEAAPEPMAFSSASAQEPSSSSGLFRGPGHEVFGLSAPGKLRWLRSDAPAFTLYEHTATGLALPSPSAFLRGRTPFQEGPLTRDRLEVFIDQLLEQQDGAALALGRLVRGEVGERPEWFARLLLSPTHRHKLQRWLLQEREVLGLFAPELHLTQSEFAGPVLQAVATEPLFGYLREVRVDTEDTRWLDFMRFVRAIPHVRVIGCKHGEELARFEPGPGTRLDTLTARFYERHL